MTGNRKPAMLMGMTEQDSAITLAVFDAVRSSRGQPGHNDRRFLEAVHFFTVHSITWRALPEAFGNWNSVWKRFWRLSRSGVFEAFFARGVTPVIPRRENSKQRRRFFPKRVYKLRARIEQTIGKLKRFKRVAMRCEKTDTSYSASSVSPAGYAGEIRPHGLGSDHSRS